jgi:hypothetical protein
MTGYFVLMALSGRGGNLPPSLPGIKATICFSAYFLKEMGETHG